MLYALETHDLISYRDMLNSYYDAETNIYVMSDNSKKYDKELINNSGLGLKLKTNYNINDFNKHTYIGNCYKYFNVRNDGDVYTLSTSKIFMCFSGIHPLLEQVNVKIRVNNEVIDSNADSHSDNVYTWNITKENASNKPIIISYRRDATIEEVLFDDDKVSIVFIVLAIIVVAVIFVIAYNKNKKNNQI